MTQRLEHELQRAVYRYLKLAVPQPCVIWSVDHAGKATLVQRAMLKARGCVAGIHDVFVLWGGHLITIELKAPGGRPTEGQRDFADAVIAAGASSFLAESIDDVESALRQCGVPVLASAQGRGDKLSTWQAKPKAKPRPAKKRDDPAAIRRMMRPGGYADRDPNLIKNRTLV
jgi:hypothetical protein